jgi:hypothetical protein
MIIDDGKMKIQNNNFFLVNQNNNLKTNKYDRGCVTGVIK